MEQQQEEIIKEYLDFLDDGETDNIYAELVKTMIDKNKKRLLVNINDLRRKYPQRAIRLVNNCFEEQVCFEKALNQFAMNANNIAKFEDEFFVGFEGSFGNKHVTPRSLTSRFLGNLVCVEGIVTKCSLVRPKVVKSVHYCLTSKTVTEKTYTDLTSFEAFPQSSAYPTTDKDGHPLETEFGLCNYKDHQTITIQEMPEKAPTGQLPRSVDVICDNDLVDSCKPGDRVQVIGSYRCLPGKHGGYTTGTFRTVLLANNIMQLSQDAILALTRVEINECKKLAERHRKNIFEVLSKSLAPSIHGQEFVKKAVLCLLLGGVEKTLPNKTRLRGDINVLLIGDPSVAKSQLLRYVLFIAPRAIPTTGRGSSGVGLTAAVTADQETGERRLEAGAMVLADRGVICIDEFDKMSDIDRTAIHEVMEQGKVTIAKAGIHASLNARCSVLAAANPVYGRYDQYKTPMENIGLQDSLLSRFDLLFVMLDVIDSEQDHIISEHVVRMHRYRPSNELEGEALPLNSKLNMLTTGNPDKESQQDEGEIQVYQKYDPLLHGKSRTRSEKILSINFMKKYIHFARAMKPKLTEEACKVIADEYTRLRSEDMLESHVARTQPVTARTLETLIRLATAHAKARLSIKVTVEDAQAAIELVQYAYFKRVLEKNKKRRRSSETNRQDDQEEEEQSQDKDEDKDKEREAKRKRKTPTTVDPYEYESEEDAQLEPPSRRLTRQTTQPTSVPPPEPVEDVEMPQVLDDITDEKLAIFKKRLNKMFTDQRTPTLSLKKIHEDAIFQEYPVLTVGEINAALGKMSKDDMIMLEDDIVMRI